MSLLFLFWANIVCRIVAIAVLAIRTRLKYQLKHVDIDQRCKTTGRSNRDSDVNGVEMSPMVR